MSVAEWFITWVLPLFCDVSMLPAETLTDIRVLFAFAVAFWGVMFLVWLPCKYLRYLFSGGKKRL